MDDIRTESTIGERIKRLRNCVLMTQDDLAAAAGVSTDLTRKSSRGRAGFGPGVAPAEPGGGKAGPRNSVGDGQGWDPAQRQRSRVGGSWPKITPGG
jgi:hypothetical protein